MIIDKNHNFCSFLNFLNRDTQHNRRSTEILRLLAKLLQGSSVIDLLTLLDNNTFAGKLLGGNGHLNAGDLFAVHGNTTLLDQAAGLTLGGAQAAAKALFMGGGNDSNMPTTEIAADKLVDGKIGFLNLMVICGLAPSNKQARQLVQQGGILVNDEKMDDPTFSVTEEMLHEGVKIRKGKKVFHKAVLT